MTDALERHAVATGTRLAVQAPAGAPIRVVLFDGSPMIEDGVPAALVRAQAHGVLPALSAIYVESIEGAAKRGPTRCASLTEAATLDRFADELAEFLTGAARTVVVGHSLGAIAALHLAAGGRALGNDVVALSAALWWPGEDGQLSGDDVIDEVLAAPDVRIWMCAGEQEEPKLLRSNETLATRLAAAGRPTVRRSHPGGHDVRPADVVDGIAALLEHE